MVRFYLFHPTQRSTSIAAVAIALLMFCSCRSNLSPKPDWQAQQKLPPPSHPANASDSFSAPIGTGVSSVSDHPSGIESPDAALVNYQEPVAASPTASTGMVSPNATQPNATQPNATQPNITQPNTVQPNAVHPNAVHPNAVHPNAVQHSPFIARDDCPPYGPGAYPYAPPYPGPGSPWMHPEGSREPWPRDEYLLDGGDRGTSARIGDDWTVQGMELEDTVAHFDTLAGDRRVEPSNRVQIYAPRFGSVRKVDGVLQDQNIGHFSQTGQTDLIARHTDLDSSILTHQTLEPGAQTGRKSSSVFLDQTRGLTVENPLPVATFDNVFAAYENFSLIRFGVFKQGEKARLAESIQAAEVWQHELPVQAVVDNRDVVVARGVDHVEATVGVEEKDSKPQIRIVKLASSATAKPGDEIEFTIRFDNVGNERIGNVTILDNLTPRLEYVKESAQCDLAFDFFTTENEGGSLLLRWEIKDPLDVGKGGVIRFKCRVR